MHVLLKLIEIPATPKNKARNEELFTQLYDELKIVARSQMKQERVGHTLQPTALINEAYVRLMSGKSQARWKNRKHFLCVASEVMRHVLIDSARARGCQKRGGDCIRIQLSGNEPMHSANLDDILSIHEALLKFEKISPKKAQLVKLRYFAGLTVEEAADAISVSCATAHNYWNFGRAWLYRELTM